MKYGDIIYPRQFRFWLGRNNIKCRFRIDPIPGTGKFRSWGIYIRSMRTTQERRLSLAYPEYTRAKRNIRNLPDSWDDFWRADQYDRSWKQIKKKKQWM